MEKRKFCVVGTCDAKTLQTFCIGGYKLIKLLVSKSKKKKIKKLNKSNLLELHMTLNYTREYKYLY